MARTLETSTRQSNNPKRTRRKKKHEAKCGITQQRALERAKRGAPEGSKVEQIKVDRRERAQIVDIRSVTYIRWFFTLALLGLFSWLNYQVMCLVRDIFEKTGMLDKEVVITLIAGTVTQVAAVAHMIAQFLFPKTRE